MKTLEGEVEEQLEYLKQQISEKTADLEKVKRSGLLEQSA